MIITIQSVNFSYLIALMTSSLEEILECDLKVVKIIKI